MFRSLALMSLALPGVALAQGTFGQTGPVARVPHVGTLPPQNGTKLPTPTVPVTVTVPFGPGEITWVGASSSVPRCGASIGNTEPAVCEMTAKAGVTVTLAPKKDAYEYFEAFVSNQPGCSGKTCSFKATLGLPAKISARFSPTKEFILYLDYPKTQPVTVTSDAHDNFGAEVVTCGVEQPSKYAGKVHRGCYAQQPVGTSFTVTATYVATPGGAPIPVPASRISGDCVSIAAGICKVKLLEKKIVAIN